MKVELDYDKELGRILLGLLKPTDGQFTTRGGYLKAWFRRKLEADAAYSLIPGDGITKWERDVFSALIFDNRPAARVADTFKTSRRTVGRVKDKVVNIIVKEMPASIKREILGVDRYSGYVKQKEIRINRWMLSSCMRCGHDDPMGRVGDLFWDEVEGVWKCLACGAMHQEVFDRELKLVTLIPPGGENWLPKQREWIEK